MRGPGPLGRLISGLIDGCFALLLAALALWGAMQLLRSIWVPLLAIGAVLLALAAGVVLYRRRDQSW